MIVGASAATISSVKVSVSVARVSSLTCTVKVKLPAVLGTPLIRPVAVAKSKTFVPGGSLPSTSLNDGVLDDDEQPVTVMKRVQLGPDLTGQRGVLGVDRVDGARGGPSLG